MNIRQQETRIAEACGLRIQERRLGGFQKATAHIQFPGAWAKGKRWEGSPPCFTESVDAIQWAESIVFTADAQMKDEARTRFEDNLYFVLDRYFNTGGGYRCRAWYLLHATAAQRAEALLRTLNLWTEDTATV